MKTKKRIKILLLFISVLFVYTETNAQRIKVTDHKGTRIIATDTVYKGDTAPIGEVIIGDIWFDDGSVQDSTVLKIYTGSVWEEIGYTKLPTGSVLVGDANNNNKLSPLTGMADQTLVTDGSGNVAWASKEKHFTVTVFSDGDWDNEYIPLWRTPNVNATITKVTAFVGGTGVGPALQVSLGQVLFTDLGNAIASGNQIFSKNVEQGPTNDEGVTIASGDLSVFTPDSYVVLATGAPVETATVDYITITVYYVENP